MEKRLQIAKNIIMEESAKKGFKVGKIILFGSRARGDYKEDSDWDFLIIVNEELNRKEKRAILECGLRT
ncbi:MAG: nucleotidyltransferase domain-containing protein [Thermotogae bacterium]|nr:nucleotidyltransferase domain-containing protein [Thermotogota bacterium]